MRIVLIRHPAPLIDPGICYGRLDVGLDPSAEQDIARLALDPDLQGATRVRSSPAGRCKRLADAIALARALPLTIDRRLRELDFGDWEGQQWDVIARADLDRWAASPLYFAPPGGESGAELIMRIREFHADLRCDRQNCIIVSHGGPLKVLAALLRRMPVDLLVAAPAVGSVQIVTCLAD